MSKRATTQGEETTEKCTFGGRCCYLVFRQRLIRFGTRVNPTEGFPRTQLVLTVATGALLGAAVALTWWVPARSELSPSLPSIRAA